MCQCFFSQYLQSQKIWLLFLCSLVKHHHLYYPNPSFFFLHMSSKHVCGFFIYLFSPIYIIHCSSGTKQVQNAFFHLYGTKYVTVHSAGLICSHLSHVPCRVCFLAAWCLFPCTGTSGQQSWSVASSKRKSYDKQLLS